MTIQYSKKVLEDLWMFFYNSFKNQNVHNVAKINSKLFCLKLDKTGNVFNHGIMELAIQAEQVSIVDLYATIIDVLNPKNNVMFEFTRGKSLSDACAIIFKDPQTSTESEIFYHIHIVTSLVTMRGTISINLKKNTVNLTMPPALLDFHEFSTLAS